MFDNEFGAYSYEAVNTKNGFKGCLSPLEVFNFDANYNWATSKNLNQYQILHFATHGFVNPDQPELSGIALSLVNKDGQQVPGYLRLADLFEQDYPAELIVLSAC